MSTIPSVASHQAAQSAFAKPPRKQEGHLDESAIEDTRGGPLMLEDLKLEVLTRSPHYLVINKGADVRLDGDFNVTVEKALARDFPDVPKFRWIHQLDFATSGVMCIGVTKESTAAASGLFQKKCVEKEYLALVHGTLPAIPPRSAKAVAFSRLNEFIEAIDNPTLPKKQHELKFTKKFKGPRTGPSLFAMDQGVIRRKLTQLGDVSAEDKEFLRKKWNDLTDDVQQRYFERAAVDKLFTLHLAPLMGRGRLRYEAELKAHQQATAAIDMRYEAPATGRRPRAMSENPPSTKRPRVGSEDMVTSDATGYIFNEPIAASPDHSFRMEIVPPTDARGKASTTVAFVLGYGMLDGKPITKVLLRPLSGRRHQLRLHLSHHGAVGDVTYGNEDDDAPRMMLHAWNLNLKFPNADQQREYGHTCFKSADPFADLVKTTTPISTLSNGKAKTQRVARKNSLK
ncbi:RNA pseudouridylate synthase-like protein [Achlya hypogyna]|uniref:RNA pseudouridylate synthase-like protein n=1 Tax=Achlya hypogyna TaxID=1202772 RepID=A0A1V9Z9N6_ACHHY|nr:RNA pseudouridylate synthase-like protein [Achlya hypogyna]